MLKRALPFVLLLTSLPSTTVPALADPPTALEITYLANEGFLLRSGNDAVLIDAFVAEPYSKYAAVAPDAFARMVAGEPPFAGIDVALVSHPHRDHYQPEAARRFLERHPETLLISSPQVVDALGGASELRRTVWPEVGKVESIAHGGVRVDLFRLPHGGDDVWKIHNLGHVIHVGGYKILHVGDADGAERHYEAFKLAAQDIDVALVPYWFFGDAEGRQLVERHLVGRHTVAVHVPPKEVGSLTARLAKEMPNVVVFSKSLESRVFE